MILTVTPDPSLDRTYEVPSPARGRVLRADGERVAPGGKGVNVSLAAAAAGVRTTAVLPLGGAPGVLLAELLGARGVDVTAVSIAGRTRSNIALAEPDGTRTEIDLPGPALSPEESALLLDTVRSAAAEASWVACCGGLPPGLGPRWCADLVARAHAAGARTVLDTPGPALHGALAARPEVIHSDASELAAAVGRPLPTLGDVVKAAEELRELGAGAVLASLGGDGRLLVSAEGAHHGAAPAPAGRGDAAADGASLAGFLIAGGTGPGALASALAHGTAAVRLPGGAMPSPADLRPDRVRVTDDPPLDLQLADPGTP
ncbi:MULTISPECIES: 1-phosphofructokinase family hexose kinase [Streptomyces]|uniref:1-phosphofructokinase n=1 Tax=Streptomyces spororaveus TaxID=284039 RepID=A0ABQ3TGW8_9ACTN|nr:1-phosphofructokinase family hexose kinase [Streptomyces spororaveus]GHI79636.1 1-phosphofructokinase [Streptomyces spororaveus]